MGSQTWDWKNLTTPDDMQGEHEPLVDYNTDSAQGGSTEGEPDGHDDSDLNMGFDDPDEQLSNVHYVGSGEFPTDPPAPDVDTQAALETILPGWMFFFVQLISETWTRPSTPASSSTKAP